MKRVNSMFLATTLLFVSIKSSVFEQSKNNVPNFVFVPDPTDEKVLKY